MEGSLGLVLNLKLDDRSLEVLESLAATQRCSLDEYVLGLIRKAIRQEQKPKRVRSLGADEAPLDAFLPEGADPFAPAVAADHDRGTSFAGIQARMRFAGTPSLFKNQD